MTPIIELDLKFVTAAEAEAYKSFLSRYQRSWRNYFDPIAIRLQTQGTERLGIDMSVLPLIVDSDYRDILRFAGKATLTPGAADPHPVLLQYAIALDTETGPLARFNGEAGRFLGGITSPLGWMGNAASLYFDVDEKLWETLLQPQQNIKPRSTDRLITQMPIGINIAVRDSLKLASFLTAIRAFSEQSAPGLVTWGTKVYKEVTYVVIAPAQQNADFLLGSQLLYLPAAEGLTLTLNEGVMHRAIDRILTRRAAAKADKPVVAQAWLGEQLGAFMKPAFLSQLSDLEGGGGGVREWMFKQDSNNRLILNEWHRLFPNENPIVVHERLWGTQLVCPFGGIYHWNDKIMSVESTALGLLTDEQRAPKTPVALNRIPSLSAGLSFDELPPLIPTTTVENPADQRDNNADAIGLRVRVEIELANDGTP